MNDPILRYSGPYDIRDGTGYHVWCDDLSTSDIPDGFGSTLEKARANFMVNLDLGIKDLRGKIALAESVDDSTLLKANTEP